MDKLIVALGPTFTAGFAVQQFLEIIDPLIAMIVKDANKKKVTMGLISLLLGIFLSALFGIRVLAHLSQVQNNQTSAIADVFVTALIISAGTEGINSILKFLGYKKEEKKAEAAKEKSTAEGVLSYVNRQ